MNRQAIQTRSRPRELWRSNRDLDSPRGSGSVCGTTRAAVAADLLEKLEALCEERPELSAPPWWDELQKRERELFRYTRAIENGNWPGQAEKPAATSSKKPAAIRITDTEAVRSLSSRAALQPDSGERLQIRALPGADQVPEPIGKRFAP